MSALQDRINELNSRMLQKLLYVVLTTPIKPMSELLPLLPDHLNYKHRRVHDVSSTWTDDGYQAL